MRFSFLWLGISLLFFISCKNQKAVIPTYFSVKQTFVIPFLSNQLKNQTVKDIWVFQYPNYIGTFEKPTVFPIINPEENKLIIQGGVWENNNPIARVIYPFWKADTIPFSYNPSEVKEIVPVFTYFIDTLLVLPLNETFENQEIKFKLFNNFLQDTTSLLRTTEDKFDGIYAGKVEFNDTNKVFEIASIQEFRLPREKTQTWLEFSYKSTLNLRVGLIVSSFNDLKVEASDMLTFRDGQWNTMYINLTPIIFRAPPNAKFQLFMYANGNGENHTLYLDNIRIIHFK
jgi:hypothetical protein